MKTEICIIGAGPAGLTAGIFAAQAGARTIIIENNTTAGRKLMVTGAGRCNITHKAEPEKLMRIFGAEQGRFLSYCLYKFSPQAVIDFFNYLGLKTRVEKDGCVFPASDRAGDVRDTLVKRAKELGVKFLYGKRVEKITKEADTFIIHIPKEPVHAEKVIIATGGLSWPRTGSTGDGYRFAKSLGHNITQTSASLVPLVSSEDWPGQLAGTSVENVKITAHINNKKIVVTGALIFTDDGIGGPAVLNISRDLTDYLATKKNPIEITLDLLPNLEQTALDTKMSELLSANPKKKILNILTEFVPKRFGTFLCKRAGCDEESAAGQLKKDIRKKLISTIKVLTLSIVRSRDISEATVTRGGVNLKEIEPKTMESKICAGLFFAGEVIDVDGPCGGYNLQISFSTGVLAGSCAAKNHVLRKT
ncbi:MAG: NAD(P)/FAD-dependent oxidoreductase [Sedimentisphaerales bacterium]|nr:NAD(P)/FAD-dependent oxidoreductase [Sedimentisphaerales bacterium]